MASAIAPAGSRALAFWPLFGLACSVYDDALLDGVSTPLVGGSSSVGASPSAGRGGVGSGGSSGGGGTTTAGTDSSGMAGEAAGKGGGGASPMGGSAGSATAGTAMAGVGGEPHSGNDGTDGTMVPPSGAFTMAELTSGDRSSFAAGLKASGFKSWGSVIGFNLLEQAAVVKAYDASAYCSVQFWGKAAATTPVHVRVPDGDTHPNGNVCKLTGAADQLCYDHFTAKVALTTTWKLHSVEFADLTQLGTGYHPADGKFKADKLYALEWALPGMNASYQIWVDDVAFVECP
ncbi:MAG: hypothetical protein K0R38_7565 [Polyangiaceae bacterium]|nr:hypothetical protein [Polyangiaceae bacterium]